MLRATRDAPPETLPNAATGGQAPAAPPPPVAVPADLPGRPGDDTVSPLVAPAPPAPAPSPVAPPPAPAVAPSPPWDQIAAALRQAPGPDLGLTLAPEELGALHLEIETRGDLVRVTLAAERPETLDLIRRHAELLAGSLREAGFAQSQLSFGAWSGGGAGQEGRATPPLPPAEAMPADRPAPTATPQGPASGGLDLRL